MPLPGWVETHVVEARASATRTGASESIKGCVASHDERHLDNPIIPETAYALKRSPRLTTSTRAACGGTHRSAGRASSRRSPAKPVVHDVASQGGQPPHRPQE